jgi:hypothetical protein
MIVSRYLSRYSSFVLGKCDLGDDDHATEKHSNQKPLRDERKQLEQTENTSNS